LEYFFLQSSESAVTALQDWTVTRCGREQSFWVKL